MPLPTRSPLRSPLALYGYDELRARGHDPAADDWKRLRKGLYVLHAAYENAAPWDRYATRVHAYFSTHPRAVLCLESAAVIHGLPRFGETARIHVFDPQATRSSTHADVCVHASADEREIVDVDGILVTSRADTVVDLARVLPPAHALAVVDAAISRQHHAPLRLDDLGERAADQQSRRGAARMRWVRDHADERSESPAESTSRAVILWSGFEPPLLQVEFHYEGRTDRGDFFFPDARAIGEADGWGKYGLGDPTAAAIHLRDEKRREDRLRRHGHPFARWEGAEAEQPAAIGRALRGAGVRIVARPHRQYLATLGRNPRAVARRPQR